jgi:hypothetical protein
MEAASGISARFCHLRAKKNRSGALMPAEDPAMSDLHIPIPCHESWDGMTPAGDGRHCAACNHLVIDVAGMPVAEGRRVLDTVATVLTGNGRRTCVRAHATPSGRLVPGRRKLLTSALAGILACSIAGCAGDGPDLVEPQPRPAPPAKAQPLPADSGAPMERGGRVLMGDICVKGRIVTPPVTTDPPTPAPLTGTPVPRPQKP